MSYQATAGSVLMISPHFPPSGNPQAFQSLRLAETLAHAGMQVEVLAAGAGNFEPANSHAGGPFRAQNGNISISRFPPAGALVRRARRFHRLFHPLDPYCYEPGLVRVLQQTLRERSFDVILSCSEPLVSHDAVFRVSHGRTRPLYIHWFSDPVPDSNHPEMMKLAWRRKRCDALIARCMQHGSVVIGVTEEILKPFRAVAPAHAEILVLPHTFDPRQWPWPPNPASRRRHEAILLHAGSLYWTRHPFVFLDGIAMAAQKVRVRMMGSVSEEIRASLARKQYPFPLEWTGSATYEESHKAMGDADILCVID